MAKKNTAPEGAEATQDYIVLTPIIAHGDTHPPGATIALTAEQAEAPLRLKAIKPKAAPLASEAQQ